MCQKEMIMDEWYKIMQVCLKVLYVPIPTPVMEKK